MPKSMFQQGIFRGGFTPLKLDLGGARLAQSTEVSNATRDDMLNRLLVASDKFALVNAWNLAHPNALDAPALLGADAPRYKELLRSIDAGGWGGASSRLHQALVSPEPEVWTTPPASDWNATENWIMAMTELGAILARHPSLVPGALKPGAPATAATGVNPWLIGGGIAAVALVAVLALS